MNGYLMGASSMGINFDVKTYKSFEELPFMSRENTLAVISDVPCKNYSISPVEPVAPKEGMVWVENIFSSNHNNQLNVLPHNELLIYPSMIYQRIGGIWVLKQAYLRKNGAWAYLSLRKFLIRDGKFTSTLTELVKTTGGANFNITENYSNQGYLSIKNSVFSKEIELYVKSNPIDIRGFKNLHLEYSFDSTNSASTWDAGFEPDLNKKSHEIDSDFPAIKTLSKPITPPESQNSIDYMRSFAINFYRVAQCEIDFRLHNVWMD